MNMHVTMAELMHGDFGDLDGYNEYEVCEMCGDHNAHVADFDWHVEGCMFMEGPDDSDLQQMRDELMSQAEEDMRNYQCLIYEGLGVHLH